MTALEIEYRREIRRAVLNGDAKRAQDLREWAFEHYNLDLMDFMVDADTR